MTLPNQAPGNTGTFAGAPTQNYPAQPMAPNHPGTHDPSGQPMAQNHPGQTTAPPLATAPAERTKSRRSRETKTALLSTEFWAYIGAVAAVVATCLYFNSDNGGPDEFTADQALRYVTWLTIGYMVARGLAKAGRRFGGSEDH
ncbi:MAG TPA: hypothetical protein VMZ00_02730 [Sporichthya sp.]|nr:hypothetical protein [Sporichthya sp.]